MHNITSKSLLDYNLSGSALKIIATLSMVSDHIAYFFVQHGTMLYDAMRCFGRIAFPVFAFLIAEGFAHTSNRLRYFITLLAFALISEVPWQLLMGDGSGHNVMFTLALGVLALQALRTLRGNKLLSLSVVTLIAYIATRYHTDYEWRGVCMIVIFYMFREVNESFFKKEAIVTQNSTKSLFYTVLPSLLPFMQVAFSFPLMVHYGLMGATFACAAILLYNGERGWIKGKAAKYAFYVFYPLHLFIIWLVSS